MIMAALNFVAAAIVTVVALMALVVIAACLLGIYEQLESLITYLMSGRAHFEHLERNATRHEWMNELREEAPSVINFLDAVKRMTRH